MATKIEQFKEARRIARQLAEDRTKALGRDSSANDKHRAHVSFTSIINDRFCPIGMNVDLSYGYYGNSSAYSATSKEMGAYLAQAMTARMPELLDAAVTLAEAAAEKARLEAEAEAREVLLATAAA